MVSQDSGHDNSVNTDPSRNGGVAFGFDEQARLDFGYHSYDVVTRAAKALIGTYYEKAPERSYFVGCSEGGREAMMMSQRFPEYFDGILACALRFQPAESGACSDMPGTCNRWRPWPRRTASTTGLASPC